MFTDREAFKTWAETNAEPGFATPLAALEGAKVDAIQQVFEKYGAKAGGDMMALSGTLGEATPMLVRAMKGAVDPLKPFVVEAVVALYRLMERGPSGEAAQQATTDPMMAMMFPDGSIEDAFVRPLATQAADSSLQILGG